MSGRKPLEPGCDGSVLCPVPGHVPARRRGGGLRFEHIVLTYGQRKTLAERRREAKVTR